MNQAAFFDMDKTLIAVNSARLWVEFLWREGELRKRDLLRSAAGLVGYQLAVVDMEKLASDAALRLAGESEAAMRERIADWYQDEIKPTIRPQMLEFVEEHRSLGEHLVLLTASGPYVAQPLAEDLGFEHVISTRFEVVDDQFTGKLASLCYGQGKVELSEAWATKHNVELSESWFYSDSFTDVPMLERVGNPVVVHPDARLARWAKKKGLEALWF